MTKIEFGLGVLAIFAAILLHNLTSPHRYTVIHPGPAAGGSVLVKADGITGMTWKLRSDKWVPASK